MSQGETWINEANFHKNMFGVIEYYVFHYGMTNLKQKYNHLLSLIKVLPHHTKHMSFAGSFF